LDDSLLNPFQLASSGSTELQADVEKLAASLREPDQAPPLAQLRDGYRRLKDFGRRTEGLVAQVEGEVERWQKLPADPGQDEAQQTREAADRQARAKDLADLRGDLAALRKAADRAAAALAENRRDEGWTELQKLVRRQAAAADQLFVLQTQVRGYLVRLRPVKWQLPEPTSYALSHRLDLMNVRGRVVDAWRQIAVTANALEAGFNVFFNANISTPPAGNNPVGFRASASDYRVGFQFDSPLNRVAERNAYRASLV